VLAELRDLGPVAAVHGNVDSPELRRAPHRSMGEAKVGGGRIELDHLALP
jgi:hypothetical protein